MDKVLQALPEGCFDFVHIQILVWRVVCWVTSFRNGSIGKAIMAETLSYNMSPVLPFIMVKVRTL